MPFGIDPETLLIVGILGGVGTAATFTGFKFAQEAGPKLTINDLRPSLPWEGLPFPRFVYTHPELLESLRRR